MNKAVDLAQNWPL